MSVPWSQMWTVLRYVVAQRLRGRQRYPLVLMLEPLLRCNLACAGCGKIQHPPEVLRQQLTPEQCWAAADECGAPVVSIPGGEPLLHPQIDTIVEGLVARRKYVYLCTNALRLEEMLPRFRPSRYLAFSIHLDGPREEHDHAVCRRGVFDIALSAIQAARRGGFRVTTNTTLFAGIDPPRFRAFFDQLMQLGVEGLTLAPGYRYAKAPDQDHFLSRDATQQVFRQLFAGAARRWRLNHTPLYLAFLQGDWPLECSPWGNPTYNVFGWQRPCYLLEEGSCTTFAELMSETPWERYGRASGHAACRDCMAHCGYEPSAVADTFGSWRGWWATIGWHLGWSPRARHAGLAASGPAAAPASQGSAAAASGAAAPVPAAPAPAATATIRVSGATTQPAAPHLVQLQPVPPRVWES